MGQTASPWLGALLASLVAADVLGPSACPQFPSSMLEFRPGLAQPAPALVRSEYRTGFIQQKW